MTHETNSSESYPVRKKKDSFTIRENSVLVSKKMTHFFPKYSKFLKQEIYGNRVTK